MNKRLWVFAAVGALVGATAVQTIHIIHDRSGEKTFKERLRCKALADNYVKDHTNVLKSISVTRIEFSRNRSSCIMSTMESFSTEPLQQTAVQHELPSSAFTPVSNITLNITDLLTGENLFTRTCSGRDDCAQSIQKQEDAFENVR